MPSLFGMVLYSRVRTVCVCVCVCVFKKYTINIGLCLDTCELICFKLGVMLDTASLQCDSSLNDLEFQSQRQRYRKARTCAISAF